LDAFTGGEPKVCGRSMVQTFSQDL